MGRRAGRDRSAGHRRRRPPSRGLRRETLTPRIAWAATLAAVAAAGVVLLATDGSPPSAGTRRQTIEAAPASAPAAPASEAGPTIATRAARLRDIAVDDEPAPVGLDIDAIDIAGAPIDAVAVEADGSMEIPTDISRVGWYEYGPSPGEDEGSAVLTAHIDSRTQGAGVFYDLDALAAGDAVDVHMSDGTTRAFVVDALRQIPKVHLPAGDIFRRDGPPQLALITCGGAFDESSRHYRDNIVVLTTPAA